MSGKKQNSALILSAAIAALGLSSMASASVLLTDNFTATGTTNASDVNFNIAARQTGTLAGTTYTAVSYAKVGDSNKFFGGTSDYLTLAGQGSGWAGGATLNYNLNQVSSALKVSFTASPDYVPGSNSWAGITIGASSNAFIADATHQFGAVFKASGSAQAFAGTTNISSQGTGSTTWGSATTDKNTFYNFSMVLSGLNGTGSAFAGNGSMIKVYSGSTLIHTYSSAANGGISQLTNGYLNFQCWSISAFDNLSIETVDPAASVALSNTQPGGTITGTTATITGTDGKYKLGNAHLATASDKGLIDIASVNGINSPTYVMLDLTDASKASAVAAALGAMATTDRTLMSKYDYTGISYDVLLTFNQASANPAFFSFDLGGIASVQNVGVVPEPTSMGLIALGALGLLGRRRRKVASVA